jgi:hypothetical protein
MDRRHVHRLAGLLSTTLAVACGSAVTPADAGDAAVDGAAADAGAAAAVMCVGASRSFPAFDRACVDGMGCVVARHQTDCCGTEVATGIASTELARFNAAEATCRMQYPGCGCAARDTATDDGMSYTGAGTIVAECRAGVCTTTVR